MGNQKTFLVFLFCVISLQGYAQNFQFVLRGKEAPEFIQITSIPLQYTSFVECMDAIQAARLKLWQDGYLSASIDSLEWSEQNAQATVFVGKKYTWATLQNGNIPNSLLTQSGFAPKMFFQKPVRVEKLYPIFEKIVRYFEDNGYPFASVYLDSLQVDSSMLSGTLRVNKGPLTKIDTIIINEDSRISRQFLLQYLGLKQGMLYNETKLKNMSTRIRELNFLQESYPWRVEFNVLETKLSIYVKNKSANRADVLIGLLPNNIDRDGKFLLTGDIKLALINALGYGENVQINWQNLQYKSPRYNIVVQWPYLSKLPIGISGKFDFYKRDTLFKNVQGELGLLYQLSANKQLKAYYELASTRLLSINTNALIINRRLPENGDVTYRTFGLEATTNQVDYKINPRKGYRFSINGSVSFRNVIKNEIVEATFDPILAIPFSYLYDSVRLKSYKYSLRSQLSYFHPITKRSVLSATYQGGLTFSSDALYRNELYQIGGFRLLRGFDEGSLFVNSYHVLTIEPRYLLSLNSYFFLFSDIANIQSKYLQFSSSTFAFSTGGGMLFETKAGLFNLSYAIGTKDDIPFQFKNAKIHFGYINFF